jgi:hypothetical protein
MDKRDDAAPEAVDDDETRPVAPIPFDRWVDLIRGPRAAEVCGPQEKRDADMATFEVEW